MNHSEFYGSMTEKYTQEFLNDTQKVTEIIDVTLVKSVDLDMYKFKEVDRT